jgi:hypothetical protein
MGQTGKEYMPSLMLIALNGYGFQKTAHALKRLPGLFGFFKLPSLVQWQMQALAPHVF